jgi:hypothetical protein
LASSDRTASRSEAATLFASPDTALWQQWLVRYDETILRKGGERLAAFDRWYRDEFTPRVRAQDAITHDDMVRVTEWKMARGVWRAPNLVLVKGNSEEAVESASRDACAKVPHESRPIAALTALAGVGPATASAVLAARHPELYPFFDELVAVAREPHTRRRRIERVAPHWR